LDKNDSKKNLDDLVKSIKVSIKKFKKYYEDKKDIFLKINSTHDKINSNL
jgi:hypothetical protein